MDHNQAAGGGEMNGGMMGAVDESSNVTIFVIKFTKEVSNRERNS